MAIAIAAAGCTFTGKSSTAQNSEKDAAATATEADVSREDFSTTENLKWDEISKMNNTKKRRFYLSLTDSVSDLWKRKDVDALSYATPESIPALPSDKITHLHYRQKVRGYRVSVDYVQCGLEFNYGRCIIRFTKPSHSFRVYCDAFSDEQLIADDSPYTKSQKAIDLTKLSPGADIYLNYVRPKRNEYLSMSSPFYFKDMDFDGEDELVVNNLRMGARGYNTYDIFKVFGVKKPLRLKGLPFNEGKYKITNYNVDYEPKTKTVLDKRYDGATGYGHYRYKSIPANKKSGLTRVFRLDDAEDMEYYSLTDGQASDTINTIQPYKKYKRVNGKLKLVERGIYERGHYGSIHNVIVLEKNNP